MSNENDTNIFKLTKSKTYSRKSWQKSIKKKLYVCEHIYSLSLVTHTQIYVCIHYITNSHTIFIAQFHHTTDDLLSILLLIEFPK